MPCVFISHSSLDREVVEREIITPLRVHGVDTWYSTDDIQTASEWERQIHKGLTACDWFLVALSPRAVESEWVRREVHWAVMRRKDKVVPVMLETCEPEDLHLGLLPIQYIDFRGGGGRALERLLAIWGLDKGTQVRSLYQAAQEAMAKEDWTSAAETLEAVLQLDPTHSQSLTDLDHVRRQEYLASLYEEGSTAVREKRWSDALFKLGRLREAGADYKDVEGLIAFARAELDKAEAEQLYRRATEAAERVDWASAVELFQAVLNITPLHAGAQAGLSVSIRQKELAELYEAGREHLEGKRWGEALKMFRRVRLIDRTYKGVGELIADADAGLAEEEEEREKKERQARKEVERQNDHARSRTVSEDRHGADKKMRRVRRVISLPYGVLKTFEINTKKLFRALILSLVVVGLFIVTVLGIPWVRVRLAERHFGKADALFKQAKYAEAEPEYLMAVEYSPSNAEYHDSLAVSLHRQKKYREAEDEYRKAIVLDPDNESYHLDFGNILLEQGENSDAEVEYKRAIELNPKNGGGYYNLGITLGRQGKYEEAEAVCRKVVGLYPKSADYHLAHGVSLFSLDRYGEAEDEFRNAIGLNPNKAEYHNKLGNVLDAQNNYRGAEYAFKKAIELDPANPAYHNNLGVAFERQGRHKEADDEFRKAIAFQPGNSLYHTNLAIILHGEAKHDEEKAEYEKVVQIDPDSDAAKQYLIKKSGPLNLSVRLEP